MLDIALCQHFDIATPCEHFDNVDTLSTRVRKLVTAAGITVSHDPTVHKTSSPYLGRVRLERPFLFPFQHYGVGTDY